MIGRLVKRFGELTLVVAGALLLALNLLLLPYVGPLAGGLTMLMLLLTAFSIGNSLATPSLTTLASKSASAAEQGGIMGVTQSAASLARAVGPLIGGFLIYSAAAGPPLYLDDHSLRATFWAASGIMLAALLVALYLKRAYASRYAPLP